MSDNFHWEDEKHRVLTVDKQLTHFWWTLRAWAPQGNAESRLIIAGRCDTWDEIEEVRDHWNVPKSHVGVDARYKTEEVQEMCARMGYFWLMADDKRKTYDHKHPGAAISILKPYGKRQHVDVFQGTARAGKYYADGWHFSKNWALEKLASLINGIGTKWGLPDDVTTLKFRGTNYVETDYLSQINSWTKAKLPARNTGNGVDQYEWKKVYRDDHFRAAEEMNLIMACLLGIVPSEIG